MIANSVRPMEKPMEKLMIASAVPVQKMLANATMPFQKMLAKATISAGSGNPPAEMAMGDDAMAAAMQMMAASAKSDGGDAMMAAAIAIEHGAQLIERGAKFAAKLAAELAAEEAAEEAAAEMAAEHRTGTLRARTSPDRDRRPRKMSPTHQSTNLPCIAGRLIHKLRLESGVVRHRRQGILSGRFFVGAGGASPKASGGRDVGNHKFWKRGAVGSLHKC